MCKLHIATESAIKGIGMSLEFNQTRNLECLLIDMNSFFASCEQQDRPELRGKPIAIVPSMHDSTTVLAASYEAKRFGVSTGTRVFEAKRKIPKIIFVPCTHRKYLEYHEKVKEAVDEICPVHRVLSIDEMYCRLIGQETDPQNARRIAIAIKNNIRHRVGACLTSSVGISVNPMLAKMASDLIKPDGLVVVPKDKILEIFGSKTVSIIPGVGPKTSKLLVSNGIHSVSDLMGCELLKIRQVMGGPAGMRLIQNLNGDWIDHGLKDQQVYSAEHVLPPEFRVLRKSLVIGLKLLGKVIHRIRRNGVKAGRMGIYIAAKNGESVQLSKKFLLTDDRRFFIRIYGEMEREILSKNTGISPLKISVQVSEVENCDREQLSLFQNQVVETKAVNLNLAIDEICAKFGSQAILPAPLVPIRDHAKSGIAFSSIPDFAEELG